MNWIPIKSVDQIDDIIARSADVPCIIFKHSTSCSISSMAKFRLEGDWNFSNEEMEAYYLDLLANRSISSFIADKFSVHHESPQVLLIKDGACKYDASHLDITVSELKEGLVAKW